VLARRVGEALHAVEQLRLEIGGELPLARGIEARRRLGIRLLPIGEMRIARHALGVFVGATGGAVGADIVGNDGIGGSRPADPLLGELRLGGTEGAAMGLVLALEIRGASSDQGLQDDEGRTVDLAASVLERLREAKGLVEVLQGRRMRLDGIVLNRVDPPVPPLPASGVLRRTVAAQVPASQVEPSLGAIEATYAAARAQSDRARRVQLDLERSYPDMPLCTVERVHPPPTGLEDLLAMGQSLLG